MCPATTTCPTPARWGWVRAGEGEEGWGLENPGTDVYAEEGAELHREIRNVSQAVGMGGITN